MIDVPGRQLGSQVRRTLKPAIKVPSQKSSSVIVIPMGFGRAAFSADGRNILTRSGHRAPSVPLLVSLITGRSAGGDQPARRVSDSLALCFSSMGLNSEGKSSFSSAIRQYFFRVVAVWNSLPGLVVEAEILRVFKSSPGFLRC